MLVSAPLLTVLLLDAALWLTPHRYLHQFMPEAADVVARIAEALEDILKETVIGFDGITSPLEWAKAPFIEAGGSDTDKPTALAGLIHTR
jgi:hypothetical protein